MGLMDRLRGRGSGGASGGARRGTLDRGSGKADLAHLDIAGPAKSPAAPYGFTGKGPSAVSVRALIRLAESFSRK